jgi:hypothetical protein
MTSLFSGSAFLALVSLTVACHAAAAAGPDRFASQPAQEDLVWSKVLSAIAGEGHRLVVVEDSAYLLVPDSLDRQFMRERLTDLREETLQSFMRVNAVPRPLPEFEALGIAVEHAGTADLAALRGAGNPDEYWRGFYARYPDSPGLVRLTRVGFDQPGRQALVFVYHTCGGRCGTGKYVLLSGAGERWEVVGELGLFVH